MAKDTSINNPNLDMNRDPITGTPGAHPVGTGVGATGGALVGAAAGAVAGPVGAAVGLVAGAIAGGLGGKAVAEGVNPTAEDTHWRGTYNRESYYESGRTYDDYRPAYELGWNSYDNYGGDWNTAEPRLATEWESRRGTSGLGWDAARPATRAAWDRVDTTYYGDRQRDEATLDAEDTVDVLNDLLEISRDGEYGFKTSADSLEGNASLKSTFMQRAEDCRSAAAELVQHITRLGGTPADGGTTAGALHRGWVSVKAAVGADGEVSILNEAERGEDVALAAYRKALKRNLPADVRAVVQRQKDGAQKNHDQIKALRDSARARN